MDAGPDNGGDWAAFAKRLRRVYGDAMRLELTRGVEPPDEYDLKLSRLQVVLVDLSVGDWSNPHVARLAKRMYKYGGGVVDVRGVRGGTGLEQPCGA